MATKRGLVIHPELMDMPRERFEIHLEHVRSQRMIAAVMYFEGVNAKVKTQDDKLQRRLAQQFTMLGKELAVLDRALAKVEQRTAGIEMLRQEKGLLELQYVPNFAIPQADPDEEE